MIDQIEELEYVKDLNSFEAIENVSYFGEKLEYFS